MKIFKAASAMFCMAATAMIFAPGVSAQSTTNWDRFTEVTFSGPVEIPAAHQDDMSVLPAGTYTFHLLNSQSDRHIVQIQSEDRSKTYATILATPNKRLDPTDKTVVTFRERPNGQPHALRAWFYPGELFGEEFIYPKSNGSQMAMAAATPVLSAQSENSRDVAPEPAPMRERATNLNAQEQQSAAADTSNEIAQNTPPANAAPGPETSQPSAETSELPQTAGNSGLLLFGGLLALGGALSVHLVRQAS
jgi:hypothetical protein